MAIEAVITAMGCWSGWSIAAVQVECDADDSAPGSTRSRCSSIGYWGISHVARPGSAGYGAQVGDTVDPRQTDQTHTSYLWRRTTAGGSACGDEVAIFRFFPHLQPGAVFEFRRGADPAERVPHRGAERRRGETHTFGGLRRGWRGWRGWTTRKTISARDNLDHYFSGDAAVYGAFVKVLASDVTISRRWHRMRRCMGTWAGMCGFMQGCGQDSIELKNTDTA